MSISSTIQMGSNALQANDIALQVVGQNISNANTPGYLREDILLTPAPTQRMGGLLIGTGVQVSAIIQKVDKFLLQRLQDSVSDNANSSTLRQTYSQLESIVGALNKTGLSQKLTTFFNSISQIMNQPGDVSVRNSTVLQGMTLTQDVADMAQRVDALRKDVNDQIFQVSDSINSLVEDIRRLNVKIAETEGGDVSKSDAVGLRDQRNEDLENLSKLITIRTMEQSNGTVSVYTGGDYLVTEGMSRKVGVVLDSDRGLATAEIHILDTDSEINPTSGQLRGLLDSRDQVLGGVLDELDQFAGALAFEFNKVYSSGQGLKGYSTMTSAFSVDDTTKALNATGLKFTPQNGVFQVLVRNKQTGLTQTTDVRINLNGSTNDTSLEDLQSELNAINGIKAEITIDRKLKITQTSKDDEFSFANDTSGLLAALGLNLFFTGSSASDLGIDSQVQEDPSLFAASAGGIGNDAENAKLLATFGDRPLAAYNGTSVSLMYDRLVGDITQGSRQAQDNSESAKTYESTLRGQQTAISGVNLDEEAVKMIQYQRAYQATAKLISTLSELLDVLVNI